MSDQIDVSLRKAYQDNVIMLSQQKGSRFRNAVMVKSGITAEELFFDRIGATAAVARVGRHAPTPQIDTPHSRRRVTATPFDWADKIDRPDEVRGLDNPASRYAINAIWALGRSMDDVLVTAASGTSFSGKEGATPVVLPASQKILQGGTGLTIDKLREAAEILDLSDVDPDEPRFIGYTPRQRTNLLATTEVTSSDFNVVKALVEGKIDTFMGFKFILSNRLVLDSSADRLVLAWVQSGLGLCILDDIRTEIDRLPTFNYSTQVFANADFGATRIEEEKVVEIACDE